MSGAWRKTPGVFFAEHGAEPFYLHVGFSDPHRASGPGLFANHRDYPHVVTRRYEPGDVLVPDFLPDTPEVRAELAEYYQSIDRLDQGIGFVLDALDESGRADETLVIYMSDHGMPFPGAKGSPFRFRPESAADYSFAGTGTAGRGQ